MALTISMSNFNSAARYMNRNTRALSKSFARISSGKRITNASDDAAGLGVASNLDAKARSVKQGIRNANDGISIIQTAEGAYNEIGDILKRMRELGVQGSSETLASTERAYLQSEYETLQAEGVRIGENTEFNGIKLTNGDNRIISVQVGSENDSNNRIDVNVGYGTGSALGIYLNKVSSIYSVSTASDARTAIGSADAGLSLVNGFRSDLGAAQNRMDYAINAAEIYAVNLTSAQSRIEDLDYAHESAQMAKQQIIQQAGIAVMAQMRQMDKSILSLL